MRRRVAVAAGDRHPRLRESELRADHVDDALMTARQVEQPDAVLAAVTLERRQHVLGHHVEEGPPLIERRDDVIDGAEGALGHRDPPARARAACRKPAAW